MIADDVRALVRRMFRPSLNKVREIGPLSGHELGPQLGCYISKELGY